MPSDWRVVDRAGFEPAYGKPGQIYSLLPLTTRPPVHGVRVGKRSNGETVLACQWQSWERRAHEAIFPSSPPAGPEPARPGHPFLGPPRRPRGACQPRTARPAQLGEPRGAVPAAPDRKSGGEGERGAVRVNTG